jgi:nucleotide-binding universal stress UspA family protein
MHRNELVVGLDGSPSGEAALQWAAAEAVRTRVVLRAVHVLSWQLRAEPTDLNVAFRYLSHEEVDEIYRASITGVFDAVDPRPDWILQFARGDTGAVLVHQSEHAIALVIGTPGHGWLGRLIAESVAHYCLSHASCPVVAVPASGAQGSAGGRSRRDLSTTVAPS